MKFYRVKTGYGKMDFISIDETELSKAIKAQVNGGIALFKEGTIAGNNIMSIIPDWNRALGLNPDYQITGEDMRELSREVVQDYRLFLENTINQTQAALEGRPIPPLIEAKP